MKALKRTLATLGDNIRANRQKLGLSQMALAEAADLHRTYIADLELGKRNASIGTLISISRALHITLSELCSGIEKSARTRST